MFIPKAVSAFAKKVIYLPEVLGFVLGGMYALFAEIIIPFAQIILRRAAVITQAMFNAAVTAIGLYTVFSYMLYGETAIAATQGLVTTAVLLGPSHLPFAVRHTVAALFAGSISNFHWSVDENRQKIGRLNFLGGLFRFYQPLISISNELISTIITHLDIMPPLPKNGVASMLKDQEEQSAYFEIYSKHIDHQTKRLEKLINLVFDGAMKGVALATAIKNGSFKMLGEPTDSQPPIDTAPAVPLVQASVHEQASPNLESASPTITPQRKMRNHPGLEFLNQLEEEGVDNTEQPIAPGTIKESLRADF